MAIVKHSGRLTKYRHKAMEHSRMTNKLPQEILADYLAKYAGSFRVVGWTVEGFEHNITIDPKVCAEWHRMLFNVVPVYTNKLDYKGKHDVD